MRLILAGFLCTFICSCASLRPASKAYDAAADFEAFWQAFEKHYALFYVKGVQWDRSYAQYRPMVTAQTNQKELVKILGKWQTRSGMAI